MKLAVFDIDGTLTDTNDVDTDCFIQAIADANAIDGINTNWGEYPHTTDSGIMLQIFQERFGRAPSATELTKFKECFVGLLKDRYQSEAGRFTEIPGAAAIIRWLQQESEWAVAFATGCWRESALMKLRAARIEIDGIPAGFAEDAISREDIIRAAIAKAAELYGQREFERIVSIGDGLWDVRTARRLQMPFVGIGAGESAESLRQSGARHVIEDFNDANQFIRCLNEAKIPGAESL